MFYCDAENLMSHSTKLTQGSVVLHRRQSNVDASVRRGGWRPLRRKSQAVEAHTNVGRDIC